MIKCCDKVYERSGKNLFWSIKNSNEALNKLNSESFRASSLSTYDCSMLYTTLPHNLLKGVLNDLIEWTFHREGSLYLARNTHGRYDHKPQTSLLSRVVVDRPLYHQVLA